MYILSVDFGTSSVKSAVLDGSLNIVSRAKSNYELSFGEGDKVELDPEKVFESFVKCVRQLEPYLPKVELLVFDAFSPSVVFMDEDGKALYPLITHLDRRSWREARRILAVLGQDEFLNRTGVLPFPGGVSVTSILWMKEHYPYVYKLSYKIGHFDTFFYRRLTGVWITDMVNASQTGLFETIKLSGWSEDICRELSIDVSKLPDIAEAGLVLGKLRREIACVSDLRTGIPVAVGSNDAAVAHIGAGNDKPGMILNISGSSEILTILTDRPVPHPKYYLRAAVTPGLWQIFAISAGGFAVEWFRKELCKEMDEEKFYCEYLSNVIQRFSETPLSVKFSPYIAGDRHSLKKRKGGFNGLGLNTTREEMLMAVLVGIHGPLLRTISLGKKVTNLHGIIKLTGGMANEAYIHLKQALFKGYRIEVISDCSLKGAAKLGLSPAWL